MTNERKRDLELRLEYIAIALTSIAEEYGDSIGMIATVYDDGDVGILASIHTGEDVELVHGFEEIKGVFNRVQGSKEVSA